MPEPDWNDNYAKGFMPWDTDEPDENLVAFVRTQPPCRMLDVGCGTGTHSVWLASLGFEVVGVDVAALAIDRAKAKAEASPSASRCRFAVLDFLADDPPGGPFDFVFDRGVFHVFDAAADRSRFASRVAACLTATGQWLSLIGSTEGPPRDHGPSRRSVRDIADAIEPALEIVQLRSIVFDADLPTRAAAWACLLRPRAVPAQPSSVRDLARGPREPG